MRWRRRGSRLATWLQGADCLRVPVSVCLSTLCSKGTRILERRCLGRRTADVLCDSSRGQRKNQELYIYSTKVDSGSPGYSGHCTRQLCVRSPYDHTTFSRVATSLGRASPDIVPSHQARYHLRYAPPSGRRGPCRPCRAPGLDLHRRWHQGAVLGLHPRAPEVAAAHSHAPAAAAVLRPRALRPRAPPVAHTAAALLRQRQSRAG